MAYTNWYRETVKMAEEIEAIKVAYEIEKTAIPAAAMAAQRKNLEYLATLLKTVGTGSALGGLAGGVGGYMQSDEHPIRDTLAGAGLGTLGGAGLGYGAHAANRHLEKALQGLTRMSFGPPKR